MPPTAGLVLFIECQIGGHAFPAFAFSITSGVHGGGGHCDIHTSVEALALARVSLITLAEQAPQSLPVDIYVTAQGNPRRHVFGGEYVKAQWNYDVGEIEIHCRDWAGILMDERRVLNKAGGVETQNQTISQIVTSIANEYGLTPVLHLASGPNSTQGAQFGSGDRTYMPRAQSAWSVLQRIARDNGYDVHTTPDKELVFGEPGAGLPTLLFAYQVQNVDLSRQIPTKNLKIEHNPRRNKSFKVIVQSYDPAAAQVTKGQATVIGTDMATDSDTTVNAGQWSSGDAESVNNVLPSGSGTKNKLPTYVFRIDGLTADQAQAKADGIATDIAKRELIVSFETDQVLTVQIMQKAKLSSMVIEAEFTAHDYWVTSYTHEMRMTGGSRDHRAEFMTRITLLDIQGDGEGDPVSKGKGRTGRGRVSEPKTPGYLQ